MLATWKPADFWSTIMKSVGIVRNYIITGCASKKEKLAVRGATQYIVTSRQKEIYQRRSEMIPLTRITFDPDIMGGKPCIRGMRVTVGMIIGLIASGHTKGEILKLYPYLEAKDIDEALAYAAWRVEEIDVPLIPASA